MKLTIEKLKENKNEIILKIKELGCENEIKKFMELMKIEVEFGYKFSVDDLVSDVYNTNFRERTKRSGHALAELVSQNYDAKKYLH